MKRFPTQKQMFEHADSLPGPHVYSSCDKPNAKGKKWFALFSSHAELARTIEAVPEAERCFYEMVREDHLANLYLDIEFVGPREPNHGTMRLLLEQLDKRLRALCCAPEHETLGTKWREGDGGGLREILHPELEAVLRQQTTISIDVLRGMQGLRLEPGDYVRVGGATLQVEDTRPVLERHVSCSTRAVMAGLFKNSYHVVYPSVVFANNNSGAMQQTVAALCKEWIVPDGSGRAWKACFDGDGDAVAEISSDGLRDALAERSLLTEAEWAELVPHPLPPGARIETAQGTLRPRRGKEDGLVDILVYTKNRGMRTVLSHKVGSEVCFRRVPGLCSENIAREGCEFFGSFITQIDHHAPWRLFAKPGHLDAVAVLKRDGACVVEWGAKAAKKVQKREARKVCCCVFS